MPKEEEQLAEELNSSFLSNIMYKSHGLCAYIYCDLMWSRRKKKIKKGKDEEIKRVIRTSPTIVMKPDNNDGLEP